MDSIIIYICTYHEEDNINGCINSIKRNGYDNIVIIDASKNENTRNRAEEVSVKVFKAPKGLAGQRQVAIDDCNSEYLMFVDADDRLGKNCIDTLLQELNENHYDAIQASVRVLNPKTYWEKGMDANLNYCINSLGKTNMLGRPAIYKTSILKEVGMDVSFNGIGNEDAALSIKMERFGAIQGKGSGISCRYHPSSLKENFAAWKKYGLGDAQLIEQYPDKLFNILKHLLYVYPIKRSFYYVINGKIKYVGYPILLGLTRLIYMAKRLIVGK
ncbi:glycosyltransferase family 2 protein [bacterium]|nr:glycosyltransferase family 2 protein [bacterium]